MCTDAGCKYHRAAFASNLDADNIVLLADSAQELQALLDVLEELSRAAGMRPNPKKCEVVVYSDASWPAQVGRASAQWTLNDIPLKKSLHYCYLGSLFEAKLGLRVA
jgi:hypothetical protein